MVQRLEFKVQGWGTVDTEHPTSNIERGKTGRADARRSRSRGAAGTDCDTACRRHALHLKVSSWEVCPPNKRKDVKREGDNRFPRMDDV